MADDLSGAALASIANSVENIDNNLKNNTPTQSAGELTGFTEISDSLTKIEYNTDLISDYAYELGSEKGWFFDTLKQILDFNEISADRDLEAKMLQESVSDSLSDILDLNMTTDKDGKTDKKRKGKVGTSTKFDDLKDLPWALGTLGAVLANTITNKDGKNKEGKSISGFFKGLMEGVGGIAALGVALFAFAGATLIFSFVDWGKAVIGMLAFTVFTIGMVALAKNLNKEQKDLTKFAASAVIMASALGVFGISMYIASALFSFQDINIKVGSTEITLPKMSIGGAITAIASFGAFVLGMVGLAKLLNGNQADLQKFAVGSMVMCGALITFSVALVIASNIFANGIDVGPFAKYINGGAESTILKIDPIGAIAAIGTFLAFEIGLAIVARLVGNETANFIKFAVGSIVMCGALVAFAFSLVIVSNLFTNGVQIDKLNINLPPVNIAQALFGVGSFIVFLIAVVAIANVAQNFMGQIALLGAISILMSASLIAFSLALVTAGVAAFGGEATVFGKKFSAPQNNGAKALLAIPLMAGFLAAFAGLGAVFLIPFAGQAMLAGIAMASTILLAVGATVIVMAKAMALAGLITTGGEMEWEGKRFTMIPMDESKIDASFAPFMTLMDKVVDMGTKIKEKMGFFGPIGVALVGQVADVVGKVAEVIAKSMTVKVDVEKKGAKWDVHAMDGSLDYLIEVVGKLGEVADNMGFWAAIKMPILTKSMMPVIDAIDKIVDVIKKTLLMKKELQDKGVKFVGSGIDPEILNGIADPVLQIMLGPNMDGKGGLSGAANSLGFWGAAALKQVTASMIPVAETISILVNTIEKAATLGGNADNAKALVDKGLENIQYLMVGEVSVKKGFFGKETIDAEGGFIGIFNIISKVTKTIKKGVAASLSAMTDAVNVLTSVIDAVGKLTSKYDLIQKAGDMFQIICSSFGTPFTQGTLLYFFETFRNSGLKEKQLNNISDSFKAMEPAVKNMTAVIAALGDGSWISTMQNIVDIPALDDFPKAMKNFDKGMGHYADAYERIKNIPQNWIDNFGQSFKEIDEAVLNNLDKMAAFAEKAAALGKTADNLERIASAMNKIGKSNKDNVLSSAADKLGRIASDVWGNITGKSTAETRGEMEGTAAVKPVPKGQELQTIATILSQWDANGVKVYGLPTTEKAKAVRTLSI